MTSPDIQFRELSLTKQKTTFQMGYGYIGKTF